MKAFEITFLGTGAHDYSPRLLSECKDKFDDDARRSSAVLFNRTFLIDCGDHILDELRIAGADASRITDVFITHLHVDHYNAEHLKVLAAGKNPLRVWVRKGADIPDIPNIEVHETDMGMRYEVAEGLTVTCLPANHKESTHPQHFLFEREGRRFFYGLDGAWFLTETYNALKKAELDLIVLDCTCGEAVGEWRIGEHNTIPMIRLMFPSLKKWGALKENTEVYISHLAPSLHLSHKKTVELLKKDGIGVAHDGLKIEI